MEVLEGKNFSKESCATDLKKIISPVELYDIAKKSGIHEQTISDWLSGKTCPLLFSLLCVLEACGYCLSCDGKIITAGNWYEWIEEILKSSDYKVNKKIEESWERGQDPRMSTLIRIINNAKKEIKYVKIFEKEKK